MQFQFYELQCLSDEKLYLQYSIKIMSVGTNPNKPFTGGFELQTKIRVIIQDVLTATVRKISQFHDKVESFEDFFFTFKQRIAELQDKSNLHSQLIQSNRNASTKVKADADSQIIRLQEIVEKGKIENGEVKEEVKELQKKITAVFRQNQSMNQEFSKTKSRFLQFSDQMVSMKDEVSFKINKYVEETAETNTQIKINNENMKKQYFNVCLALQKNKQKYDQIMVMNDKNENRSAKIQKHIEQLFGSLEEKEKKHNQLNKKLDQMDTALYNKMRLVQSKIQRKIQELVESNIKIMASVKKVDSFSRILDEVREDQEKTRRQFLKKFEEIDQKHHHNLETKMIEVSRSILQNQKLTEKRIQQISESQEKFVDFFNQKIQFLKIQIETELSSKATAMLEEKSKTQNGATNSALDSLTEKMNKITIETVKSTNKVENMVKDLKRQVNHQIEDFKEVVETKIEKTVTAFESSSGSGVSPEFMRTLNERFQKVTDQVELKLYNMNKELSEQSLKVLAVQRLKEQTIASFQSMNKEMKDTFKNMEIKNTEKIQKVMFLVTKMRGDSIIRNQFTDKQIKQIRKFNEEVAYQNTIVFRLIPAFGECLNLIMCLIFDAEYQHAKIIQENLPNISAKNIQKFQNILQGVIYEFKEKKKPGFIHYRHKQMKKTDIVKATFQAYTSVWEDIFSDTSDNHELVPRSFYKQKIQRFVGVNITNAKSSGFQGKKGSEQLLRGDSNSKRLNQDSGEGNDSQNLNKSFHIRKKKTTAIKSKEELTRVIVEDEKHKQ